MSDYPSFNELITIFKKEEKWSQQAYRETKPKKSKQQVLQEYNCRLINVWEKLGYLKRYKLYGYPNYKDEDT